MRYMMAFCLLVAAAGCAGQQEESAAAAGCTAAGDFTAFAACQRDSIAGAPAAGRLTVDQAAVALAYLNVLEQKVASGALADADARAALGSFEGQLAQAQDRPDFFVQPVAAVSDLVLHPLRPAAPAAPFTQPTQQTLSLPSGTVTCATTGLLATCSPAAP